MSSFEPKSIYDHTKEVFEESLECFIHNSKLHNKKVRWKAVIKCKGKIAPYGGIYDEATSLEGIKILLSMLNQITYGIAKSVNENPISILL